MTTLDLFNGTNGAHPVTSLVQGKDGYLYGTCSAGGSAGAGNVYRFASRFLVELTAQSESELTLSWNAVKGQTYQAQTSLSLSPPTWNNLGSATVATNTVMRLNINPQSALRRFYRALELP